MTMLDPNFATRRHLKLGLIISGAVAGAVFGVILTRLGKIVSGAPPATAANYAWNAVVFGLAAAVASPLITWSALRRVPLWRTIVEPLVWALVAAAVVVVVGIPVLILVLPPTGLIIGILNLRRRYATVTSQTVSEPVQRGLQSPEPDALVTCDSERRAKIVKALDGGTG